MINLYCRRCRRYLHVSYDVTGDPESPVLPNVVITCEHCHRVLIFKNYREGRIVEHKNDKFFI